MPLKYLTGTPFSQWQAATVDTAMSKQLTDRARRALLFYTGDHWQMSAGWGGPMPDPLTTNAADATAFMDKVAKIFTSANVIQEVTDRHVSAVIGRPPGWQFVPINAPEGSDEGPDIPEPGEDPAKPEDQIDPAVRELEAAITDWMDRRNAHQTIRDACADYAVADKGLVRLFIPPGLLTPTPDGKAGVPTGLSIEDALELVYIERVQPNTGGTAWDRSTMSEATFAVWEENVQEGTSSRATKRTEMQFNDIQPGKKQRLTIIKAWNGAEFVGQIALDLGGLLLMHAMEGTAIVSEQLMQQQKGFNFALTAMGNNNSNAGFMERIITNAQPPGTYETDGKTGQKVFTPLTKYPGGPSATVYLTGHPIQDEQSNIRNYTDPGVVFRDPSSPEAYQASLSAYREAMYYETKQGHLLAAGDGNMSGASRVHLRGDFEVSLRDTTVAAEETYRWLLAALAKLAALFSGNPAKYDAYRATVQCNVNTGPLTDAERENILSQYEKGLRSRESTMVLLGVDDPDAELLRIRGEQPTNPVSLEELAMLAVSLLPEQVANVMQRAGLVVTPEMVTELKARYEANKQAQAASVAAKNRALNPEDQPPASSDD